MALPLFSIAQADSAAMPPEDLKAEGLRFLKDSNCSRAFNMLEKAQALNPQDLVVERALAECYLCMRRVPMGIRLLEDIFFKNEPADSAAGLRLIKLYTFYSQWQQALKVVDQLKRQYPDWEDGARLEAECYYQLNDFSRSVPAMKAVLAKHPDDVALRFKLGNTLLKLQRQDEGIQYMAEAVNQGYPAETNLILSMAAVYTDLGQKDKALGMYRKALQLRPNDRELTATLADLYYEAGKLQQAIDTYDQMLEWDKKDARSLYMIGRCYQRMGRDEEGQQLCDAAIKMDPSLARLRHSQFGQ